MIQDHRFYEMQGALAATGHLSDTELADLELHATSCASCRDCIAEMAEISRMVFLGQPRRLKRRVPQGMQERFIERAAGTGISVGPIRPVPLNFRFISIAAIAVLLTVATSFSWKAFLLRDAEKNIVPASPVTRSQPGPALQVISDAAEAQRKYGMSNGSVPIRRRLPAPPAAVTSLPNHGAQTERQFYFEPDRLLFARQDPPTSFSDGDAFWSHASVPGFSGAEGHLLTETSLASTYVANCLVPGADCKPKARAFRLDLRLASSTLLHYPQSVKAEAQIPSLRLKFHVDPARAW